MRFRATALFCPNLVIRRTLEAWKEHVRTYMHLCDLNVSYEELIADCVGAMSRLTESTDMERIKKAVENNSFQAHSGRKVGQENKRKLARKGVVGDWKNYHSSPAHKKLIKEIVGQELIQLGYEKDLEW